MNRIALALVSLALLVGTAVPDEPAPLVDRVRSALAIADPAERGKAFDAIVASGPTADALAEALASVGTWKADAPKGQVSWKRTDAAKPEDPHAQDREHTVFAYVPQAYDASKPWPVVVWLHGGVSMTEDGAGEGALEDLGILAESAGAILLSPSTRLHAEWWTPVGVEFLRGCLRDLMARYRVDPDRVAVMGFSDGGSGCFHLLAHDPDPYASLVALMPMPTVTRLAGGPTFAANVSSLPVWAANGGQDRLYPSAQVKPLMDELEAAGCDLTWVDLPDAGHELSWFPMRAPEVTAFVRDRPRKALPETVSWETAVPAIDGRRAWVEVMALDPAAPAAEGFESSGELVVKAEPRPRLGIQFDTAFEGPGLKISRVEPGSPAEAAGFQVDDVLVRAGEIETTDGSDFPMLREYIANLGEKDGDFVVKRGEEQVTLHARPKVIESDRPQRPKELGYDVPSGRIEAKAAGGNRIEVRTRGVKTFRVLLAPPLVDLSKEVVVLVNGKERYKGVPEPDLRGMLDRAASDLPGTPVFRSTIVLTP